MSLHQDHNETLTTRVRSKAENCDFTTVSECGKNATGYAEEAIKYVMLAGVGDDDIRSS